jgi:sugar (pentulose or hexulose) kinase
LGAPEDFLGFTEPFSCTIDLPDPLTPGQDAQLAYLQTAMITRLRLERMGRGGANRPSRFVVGGGPTQSDHFLKTLATVLNMKLELPEGADEATARGLADLVAYEEEASCASSPAPLKLSSPTRNGFSRSMPTFRNLSPPSQAATVDAESGVRPLAGKRLHETLPELRNHDRRSARAV